jgi:hypothetical protein
MLLFLKYTLERFEKYMRMLAYAYRTACFYISGKAAQPFEFACFH